MTLRRLGARDVALFRAIRLEALRSEPRAYASRHDDWAALPEAGWLARLERCATFASFDEDQPVGLIGLMPGDGEGEVVMVYLRASHRGSGRSAALMSAVVAEARSLGLASLRLRAARDNARGIGFYLREGFREAGEEDSGATLVMRRLL